MYAPGNQIGAAGAAALVEGLKQMTNLETLNLKSECCMVGIVCEVAVMSCMEQVGGWVRGQSYDWFARNDYLGWLEMEVYWYGDVRQCGVSMPWPDFDVQCHCG